MYAQTGSAHSPLAGALGFIILVLMCIPSYKIAKKAGYDGIAALLFSFPLISVFTHCLFAFIKWPIEEKLSNLKDKK
ncbi:hypothetical protein [Pseudomonas vancouverensis]|uniref:Uncharacterized protein n=1 Tax=Pseudomonas vancouverensis TaxID=95300 RepID=A0A1H2N466_PSEVA|nr:hypothetical protein [Pseudomonas vancouverensis]KAB0495784.1 hypothetical protein F7R09_14665 [Pseudomonas vancouverensis]TDB65586.1 hypothetical protein EIY72_08725 [Pseudomonas vancouverensis]SDU99586.1 hypothetical protein SAMN05216558_1613 [Pseudomonas vancouverensis]